MLIAQRNNHATSCVTVPGVEPLEVVMSLRMSMLMPVAALIVTFGTSATAKPSPKRARHEVMAEAVRAAVAAKDFAAIERLMSKTARAELGDITRRSFSTLQARLKDEKIDLNAAKIVRVDPGDGMGIQMVDMYLTHQGREFQMHFSVMTLGGKYDLMGVAQWIKWVKPAP